MPSPLTGRKLLVYLFLCAIWGSTWLVIKIGLQYLPPLRFAGWRIALACLLLVPFAFRRRNARPTGRELRYMALAGFLQIGLFYALTFTAQQWIESGLSALLFATFPICAGVFAHFLLPNEPLTARTIAAAGLGLVGVALIEGGAIVRALQADFSALVRGGGLVFAAAIVSAWASVLVKKHLGRVDPIFNVWAETLVGAAFLIPLAALVERGRPSHWTPGAVGSLVYLAVLGTSVTFVGLFWLIKRVPISVVSTIPLVDTVIAVALGALFLHERLPARALAGGGLILLGVFLATRGGRPEPAVP
ncbi:MAG TPA: EamA family transporter [Thermoanaerobaculia bacterium]|nr:EamA family transporter [Thermoanaerobaculia bacterium]